MKRIVVLSMSILMLATSGAMAHESQKEIMRKKLDGERGGPAKVPTGYEVQGPTFYDFRNSQVKFKDPNDTRSVERFWRLRDLGGGGAD